MMNPLQLAAFVGPSTLTIYGMIKGRNLSLDQFRRLSQRSITLKEWNAVYRYLNLQLENQNEPPKTRHNRPTRLIIAGVLVPSSIALFLLPLPFVVPFRFAQYAFDLFPSIKSLISGAILAVFLLLAFYKKRRWMLSMPAPTGYPFLRWKEIDRKTEESLEDQRSVDAGSRRRMQTAQGSELKE